MAVTIARPSVPEVSMWIDPSDQTEGQLHQVQRVGETLQITSHARGGLGHVQGIRWNISGDTGLVSAGRIDKDTPPLTTPGRTSKSSAMDISSHMFQIEIHGGPDRLFRQKGDPRPVRYVAYGLFVFS